jgi:hypothetical protein
MSRLAARPAQLILLLLLTLFVSACEAIGTIFEAGVWVGVIMVVAVIALIGFVAAKMRPRP